MQVCVCVLTKTDGGGGGWHTGQLTNMCQPLPPALACPTNTHPTTAAPRAEVTSIVPQLAHAGGAGACRADETAYYETKLVVIQVWV
jgi:hypothetical protein